MKNTNALKKFIMPWVAIAIGAIVVVCGMSLNSKPAEDPALEAMSHLVSDGYSDIVILPGRKGVCSSDLTLASRLFNSGSLMKFEREEDSYKKNCSFGVKITATNPKGFTDGGLLYCGAVFADFLSKVKEHSDFSQVTENCMVTWVIVQ